MLMSLERLATCSTSWQQPGVEEVELFSGAIGAAVAVVLRRRADLVSAKRAQLHAGRCHLLAGPAVPWLKDVNHHQILAAFLVLRLDPIIFVGARGVLAAPRPFSAGRLIQSFCQLSGGIAESIREPDVKSIGTGIGGTIGAGIGGARIAQQCFASAGYCQ